MSELQLVCAETWVEFRQVEMGSGGSEQKGRQPLLCPALFCVGKDGSCYPMWIVLADVMNLFNLFGFVEFCSRISANSQNYVRMEIKHVYYV